MKKKLKTVLGVALLGIDERSCKLLSLFFKGPCEGFASVVAETDASIDIIDTHFANSEQLVENSLARTPHRAIIVLTAKKTERLEYDNLLYLDKPIKAEQMMAALNWAQDISNGISSPKPIALTESAFHQELVAQTKPVFRATHLTVEATLTAANQDGTAISSTTENLQNKLIDLEEQRKKTKYGSARSITESDFNDFIDFSPDADFNDINARYHAIYDIKNHYQGYVQYTYQSAMAKMQILQLNSSLWKSLVILPHSREIWIDADDSLLKQMAGTWLDMDSMNVSSVDAETALNLADVEKIQDFSSFLWKLALWTSKGRYPKTIAVDSPVYLKQWPDFTRYIVTPHALRISGLLIGRGPETMITIAELLAIELRYVYIFISASHALGLAAQAKRQVDSLIQVTLPTIQPLKKNLFIKVIGRLQEK